MTRINLFRTKKSRITPATHDSVAWGKINFDKNISTLVFAALLIVCSVAVGCSSEKPKTESSTNQTAMTQPTPPIAAGPATTAPQVAAKPVRKKIVHKAPPAVTYTDKISGVTFQYPRRYVLKTGDGADELVSSGSVPMDFVQPGGVAIAAVAVPESVYPKGDLASAFFDVSVNKSLTAEQCGQFPVSQDKSSVQVDPEPRPAGGQSNLPSKLIIGDLELQSAESLTSEGTRQEASKYYHVFENGACYEFALKVASTGVGTEGGKQVDREEVFHRLEKILATVKINPAVAPEVTASAPVTPNAQENPAQ